MNQDRVLFLLKRCDASGNEQIFIFVSSMEYRELYKFGIFCLYCLFYGVVYVDEHENFTTRKIKQKYTNNFMITLIICLPIWGELNLNSGVCAIQIELPKTQNFYRVENVIYIREISTDVCSWIRYSLN